jgi:hypothetical protein
MVWLVAWCLLVLGLVFLARDAEITDPFRAWLASKLETARPSKVALFVVRMLDCAPCTSAWCSLPAGAAVVGLYLLRDTPWFLPMLAVACPVGAVGLMYGFTIVSPAQAMAAALAGLGRLGKGKKDAEGKTT